MAKAINKPAISARVQQRIADLNEFGFSNAEISRRINVHPSTVSRWRSGENVPTDANRRRLYELYLRHYYPRNITKRVKRFIIKDGNWTPGPIFKLPVARGKIPLKYKGERVLFGRVAIHALITFIDESVEDMVTNIQQPIPPNTPLNDEIIFDALSADLRLQIMKIGDSLKIIEYEVIIAKLHLISV